MDIPNSTVRQDIIDTQREIEILKARKLTNPKFSTTYDKQIKEREEFIQKLKKKYNI